MKEMQWTNVLPASPGWYWFKPFAEAYAATVLVVLVPECLLVLDGSGLTSLSQKQGMWAGPIEPPK